MNVGEEEGNGIGKEKWQEKHLCTETSWQQDILAPQMKPAAALVVYKESSTSKRSTAKSMASRP